jgi:hypothetical protein
MTPTIGIPLLAAVAADSTGLDGPRASPKGHERTRRRCWTPQVGDSR